MTIELFQVKPPIQIVILKIYICLKRLYRWVISSKFYEVIDEAFENISPDLIFVSAGFDARNSDPVAKFVEGGSLSDNAYYEMAKHIKTKQKASGNHPPIISLLEGGYIIYKLEFSHDIYEYLKGFSNKNRWMTHCDLTHNILCKIFHTFQLLPKF